MNNYFLALCAASGKKEILSHWEWIEQNVMKTLTAFENEDDITNFVKGKIESLLATKEHSIKKVNILQKTLYIINVLVLIPFSK